VLIVDIVVEKFIYLSLAFLQLIIEKLLEDYIILLMNI